MSGRYAFWHEMRPLQPKSNHMYKDAWEANNIPWMGKISIASQPAALKNCTCMSVIAFNIWWCSYWYPRYQTSRTTGQGVVEAEHSSIKPKKDLIVCKFRDILKA